MPRSEHNGDKFHYLVSYRRRAAGEDCEVNDDEDIDDGIEQQRQQQQQQQHRKRVEVRDWHTSELVVDGLGTFEEYEVSVQAANVEGMAPYNTVQKVIGYTGEDGTID
jgi:hypothetical protein